MNHKNPLYYDSEEAHDLARKLHEMKIPTDLSLQATPTDDPLDRAMGLAQIVLEPLLAKQEAINALSPGHGIGHLLRDVIHTIELDQSMRTGCRINRFVGFTAGLLHDIGIVFVGRYNESQRYVRHGEAAAIYVLHELAPHVGTLLTDEERWWIAYAIAAHTHYRTETVKGPNGEDIELQPYTDLYEDGTPIWFVWFCRWIDRLDVNGVGFIARHLLTLGEKHEDFDGTAFHETEFATAAPIELRTWDDSRGQDAEGNRLVPTALEHFRMFLLSQDNRSPYGKHDLPGMRSMRKIRDRQAFRLSRAILAATNGIPGYNPETFNEKVLWENSAWVNAEDWLRMTEPSEAGFKAAHTIVEMFKQLDEPTRIRWLALFKEARYQYDLWCKEKLVMIEDAGAPTRFLGYDLRKFLGE